MRYFQGKGIGMAQDVIPEAPLTAALSSTTLAPTTISPAVRRRCECPGVVLPQGGSAGYGMKWWRRS
jgi:hypothetical protein